MPTTDYAVSQSLPQWVNNAAGNRIDTTATVPSGGTDNIQEAYLVMTLYDIDYIGEGWIVFNGTTLPDLSITGNNLSKQYKEPVSIASVQDGVNTISFRGDVNWGFRINAVTLQIVTSDAPPPSATSIGHYNVTKVGTGNIWVDSRLIMITAGADAPTPQSGFAVTKIGTSGGFDIYLEHKIYTV
jgi:hypothetical protein